MSRCSRCEAKRRKMLELIAKKKAEEEEKAKNAEEVDKSKPLNN